MHNSTEQVRMALRREITLHEEQLRFPYYKQIPFRKDIKICADNIQPNLKVVPFYQCKETISVRKRLNKKNIFIEEHRTHRNMNA